jgi:hypothetical protein
LHPIQYCRVIGNTIFEAAGTIRDVIAYAEVTRQAFSVISLDFKEAADYSKVMASVTNLWDGFSIRTRQRSVVQINGHISANSNTLWNSTGMFAKYHAFALCLDPLIC